jgi:acetate kinase
MNKAVVVLNSGSSSLKFTVYRVDGENWYTPYQGQIEGIGSSPHFRAKDQHDNVLIEEKWLPQPGKNGHVEALERLSAWLDPLLDEGELLGVGHRVVHGGQVYNAPVLITREVLEKLESFVPLAPLHQPHNLAGIRATMEFLPGVPNVACFDTSFHHSLPQVIEIFAIPWDYTEKGVRRYGFHGLSYEYITRQLPIVAPEIANKRVVIAHIGSGASLCALNNMQSIDTTMGFTGLDGLPMGTRCGDIDPGVLLYMINVEGLSGKELEDLLYKKSGLLGISGVSNDMRTLLASDEPRAKLAIDYFVNHVLREMGAMVFSLGGLDGLVFTAGIGEHATDIRARICQELSWLGLELDEAANQSNGPRITTEKSAVSAWVIPTNEEYMIALHTIEALV